MQPSPRFSDNCNKSLLNRELYQFTLRNMLQLNAQITCAICDWLKISKFFQRYERIRILWWFFLVYRCQNLLTETMGCDTILENIYIHVQVFFSQFFDWLIIYTITGEGLQNLGLWSSPRAFEQGGIFIVPHLLWHGASVFPVSSQSLVASYDTQGNMEDLF
jgi:hypothetical protein